MRRGREGREVESERERVEGRDEREVESERG